MIAHLEGALREKSPARIVVDVGGVGYEVWISLATYGALPEVGQDVALRIHTHVRDNASALFGFHTALERELFEQLIRVGGVGPKLAQALLSGVEPGRLVEAIRDGDLGALRAAPGVGQKTAQRILVELRDRIEVLATSRDASGASPVDMADGVGTGHAALAGQGGGPPAALEAVISALVNLGTPRPRAERAAAEAMAAAAHSAAADRPDPAGPRAVRNGKGRAPRGGSGNRQGGSDVVLEALIRSALRRLAR